MDIVGRTYILINSCAYWRKCCNFVLFSLMFTAMVMFMKETGSMICAKDMES